LSDAESEAGESQVWIEIAYHCGYINNDIRANLDDRYDHIMRQIVIIIDSADNWIIQSNKN